MLPTLIQRYDKNHFIFDPVQKRETNWNFTGSQMSHFMIVLILYINLLNLSSIKLEMCQHYKDATAVGDQTIKLQNSTWYKCLNRSLNRISYVCTYVHTFVQKDVHSYARTENRKTICPQHHPICPGIIRCGGIKNVYFLGIWSLRNYLTCFKTPLFRSNVR